MKNLVVTIILILVSAFNVQAQKDTYAKRLHVVEIVGATNEKTELLISFKDGELATGKVVRIYRSGMGLRTYTTIKGNEFLDVKVIR